jgi:hypothetical protein
MKSSRTISKSNRSKEEKKEKKRKHTKLKSNQSIETVG